MSTASNRSKLLVKQAEALVRGGLIYSALKNKRDARQRLKQLQVMYGNIGIDFSAKLDEEIRRVCPEYSTIGDNADLGNRDKFDLMARMALTFDPDDMTQEPIFQAAKTFNLDPHQPVHARLLLHFLCWAFFLPKRIQRKKKRTSSSDAEFIRAYETWCETHPGLGMREACEQWIADPAFPYKQYGNSDSVRNRLISAYGRTIF